MKVTSFLSRLPIRKKRRELGHTRLRATLSRCLNRRSRRANEAECPPESVRLVTSAARNAALGFRTARPFFRNDVQPRAHSRRGSLLALVCCATFALLSPLSSPAAIKAVEHVVVIGCDGFGSVGFTASNAPVLHKLMGKGAWTRHARGVLPTVSSPNWASMIMGAGPAQHGITSNEWETNKFEIAPIAVGSAGIFPTIFGVVREQRPKARIAVVHDWDGFARLLEPKAPDLIENVK